ncbi:MAG: pyrimidine dimer DNA glycosylase/endonuclease V [Zestosphaera sp.]
MKLWSLHPKHLDRVGLLALWREGLLAQKVLQGLTKGYRHRPQLERFKRTENPLLYIGIDSCFDVLSFCRVLCWCRSA